MVPALAVLTLAMSLQASAMLPDTPQGRLVQQFIDAFNTKDRDVLLRLMEANSTAERLKQRTPEQRTEAYQQLRGQFDSLRITQVVSASETEIVVSIPRDDQTETLWSFAFDAGPPARFAGIQVKIPQ